MIDQAEGEYSINEEVDFRDVIISFIRLNFAKYMTLEELKNKKVTITVNETFSLKDDFWEDILEDYIEDQKERGLSDEELLECIISNNYGTLGDLEDCLDIDDYKVTIHD